MRSRLYYLIGLLLLALGVAAYAQTQLTNRTLSGNEVVVVQQTGPGGPSIYVPVSQMRNGINTSITTQTTGTLVLTVNTGNEIFTAAIGTITIDLPATPWDGEDLELINGTTATFAGTATIATTDGSTIVNGGTGLAFSTAAAGTSSEYRYALSTNSWYKIR